MRRGPSTVVTARLRKPNPPGTAVPPGGRLQRNCRPPTIRLAMRPLFPVSSWYGGLDPLERGQAPEHARIRSKIVGPKGKCGQAGGPGEIGLGQAAPGAAHGLRQGNGLRLKDDGVPLDGCSGEAVLPVLAGHGEAQRRPAEEGMDFLIKGDDELLAGGFSLFRAGAMSVDLEAVDFPCGDEGEPPADLLLFPRMEVEAVGGVIGHGAPNVGESGAGLVLRLPQSAEVQASRFSVVGGELDDEKWEVRLLPDGAPSPHQVAQEPFIHARLPGIRLALVPEHAPDGMGEFERRSRSWPGATASLTARVSPARADSPALAGCLRSGSLRAARRLSSATAAPG